MGNEGHLQDLGRLWRNQPADERPVTIEEVRRHDGVMKNRVNRRNLREYIAAVIVIVIVAVSMWLVPNTTMRIGGALMAAGVLYVVYHLHRWGSVRMMPADLALQQSVAFHRSELVRQRDLLRSVWWWYLLPLFPGPIVIWVGAAMERPDQRPLLFLDTLVFLVLIAAVGLLNHRAAKRIQRRIDILDEGR